MRMQLVINCSVLCTVAVTSSFSTSKRTDEIDGITNTFLPFTCDFHWLFIVIDDQKCCSGKFEVVFLLEIFRRSRCRKVIDNLIRKFILSYVFLTSSNAIALFKFLVYMPIEFQSLLYLIWLTWKVLYHWTYLDYMHLLVLLHRHSQVFGAAWIRSNQTCIEMKIISSISWNKAIYIISSFQ